MPPAMVGPGPSMEPPLAVRPFTVLKSRAVSKSQITTPSRAAYALRWPSTDPENTTPGMAVTAADWAGLQLGRSPQDGGAAAHTFLPLRTSKANRPPPLLGSTTSFFPVMNSGLTNPTSESAAYMFV